MVMKNKMMTYRRVEYTPFNTFFYFSQVIPSHCCTYKGRRSFRNIFHTTIKSSIELNRRLTVRYRWYWTDCELSGVMVKSLDTEVNLPQQQRPHRRRSPSRCFHSSRSPHCLFFFFRYVVRQERRPCFLFQYISERKGIWKRESERRRERDVTLERYRREIPDTSVNLDVPCPPSTASVCAMSVNQPQEENIPVWFSHKFRRFALKTRPFLTASVSLSLSLYISLSSLYLSCSLAHSLSIYLSLLLLSCYCISLSLSIISLSLCSLSLSISLLLSYSASLLFSLSLSLSPLSPLSLPLSLSSSLLSLSLSLSLFSSLSLSLALFSLSLSLSLSLSCSLLFFSLSLSLSSLSLSLFSLLSCSLSSLALTSTVLPRLVEVRMKVFIVLLLILHQLRCLVFMINIRLSLRFPQIWLALAHLSLIHIELATLARFFTQMEMCTVTWPSPLTICCPISHEQPAGPANRPVTLPAGTVTDGPSLKG